MWGTWVSEKSLSHVRLFVTLWTVAHQAPPSMEFSRQEYWSGLPYRVLSLVQFAETEGRTVVARGWGKEGMYTYKFTFFVWVLCDNEDSPGCLVQVRKNLGSGSCFLLHWLPYLSTVTEWGLPWEGMCLHLLAPIFNRSCVGREWLVDSSQWVTFPTAGEIALSMMYHLEIIVGTIAIPSVWWL